MNLNLYGHDKRWLMVDCGVTFQRKNKASGKTSVLMPDPGFISEQRDKLPALALTHAHEDHIGAVSHLWPRLQCPIYATPFTAHVLERKLNEAGLAGQAEIIRVSSGQEIDIGPFKVEWIKITHSIPEAHGLMIRTQAGRVFHTGDWKLDSQPVIGEPVQQRRFQDLAAESIDAMVCDSTNALVDGVSASEGDMFDELFEIISTAKGAVVVTTFASNLARLTTLAKVARAANRNLSLFGRSLVNMQISARETGYWDSNLELTPPHKLRPLPRNQICIVATGSQGDFGAALDRLSRHQHPSFRLQPKDTVIFSSRIIPGNELEVKKIMDMLKRSGIRVITSEDAAIHASGHPAKEELKQMYDWVQPNLVIPVHGTLDHMHANAVIAESCGVPRRLVGTNGDLFQISPQIKIEKNRVFSGRLEYRGKTKSIKYVAAGG